MRIKGFSWNTGTSNEFGRQNRTSFELSSAGESKLILDEIQYQLDFLKTDSFVNNRRKAVITLLNIFATSTKNIASVLTTTGLKDIFLHLGCLLTTNNDPEIKEGIVALIFMLIQNKDGGLNTAVKLPSVVVKALVQTHNSATANNHSDSNIGGGNRSRTVGPVGKTDENPALAFHSRRKKFATSSNTIGNNPLFHSKTWPDCGDILEDTECVETKEAAGSKNTGTETPVKNDMSIGAVAMIHRKRKFGSASNLSSETLQALSQQQQEKKTGSNATTPSTTPLKRSKTVSGEMRISREEGPLPFQPEPATSSSVAEVYRDHSSQDNISLRDQSLQLSETAFTSPSPKKRNAANNNGEAPTSSTATTPYTVHKTNTLATPLNSVLHCANIQSAVRELWPTLFSQFVRNSCVFCTQPDTTETAEEVRIRQAELDTEMLSLVVVNRYLLDTVSRLTTSNTSGYSSNSGGSGTSGGAGRGEDGSTAEQQNAGDGDGESSELSQALTSCQNMLREHDQRSGVSYLRRLCKQLAVDTDVISATVVAQGSGREMGGQAFQTPDEKKLLQISQFRVFLALGILEAACFKNPANQVYISTIKVRANSTNTGGISAFNRSGTADSQTSLCGDNSTDLPLPYSQQSQQQNHTSHRPSSSVSVPVLLLQLLHTLSPAVMRGIIQLVSGSTAATGAAADGGTADDILGGDVTVTRHKNSELFSRMFPELVTGSVKCDNNSNDSRYNIYNTASSQETLNTANTTGSAGSSSNSSGGSQSAARHSLVGVTVHTLFTSCLETLISVTNNNHAACTALAKHPLTFSGNDANGAEDVFVSSTLSTASSQRSQRCGSQSSAAVAEEEQNGGSSNGGAVKRVNSYGRRHKSATLSLDDETNKLNNTAGKSEDSSTNSDNRSTGIHFLTALLAYCVAWRHVLVQCASAATTAAKASGDGQKESSTAPSDVASGVKFVSAEGALSTSETFTERYIFDTSLYVMSLLTNLAEYSHSSSLETTAPLQNRNNSNSNNSNTVPMNVCVVGSLSAFPHIQSFIPTASQFVPVSVGSGNDKEVSSDGVPAQQMELVQYLVSDAYRNSHSHDSPASIPDNDTAAIPPSNSGSDLLQLLVALVLSETRGFLSDIVATDGAINQDNVIVSSAAVSAPQLEMGLQGTTAAEPDAPEPVKPQQTHQQSGADAVPIAELILSSHAILLLHTMTVVTISSSDSGNDHKGDRNNSGVAAESTALVAPKRTKSSGSVAVSSDGDSSAVDVEVLLLDVRERLPRRSNWLLIRVLKAFMALQMQTGIMLLESVTPVLRAIQSMTQQDTNTSSLLCGALDSATVAGVDTQLDDDWEKQLYCDDYDDDRMQVSSATAAKVHTTAATVTATQQALGDWVWNGRDFVWEATATTITVHNSHQNRNQSVNNSSSNSCHSIVHNSGKSVVTSSATEEVSWLESVIVGDLSTATAAHNNNTTSITTMTTLISSSGSGRRRGGGKWPEETPVGVECGDETEEEFQRGTAVMEVGDDLLTADDDDDITHYALANGGAKPAEAKRSVSAESRRDGRKSVPAAKETGPKTVTTIATTTTTTTAKVTVTTTADKHKLPQSVLIPQPVMGSFSQTSYSSSHSQHSVSATESTQSGVRRSSSVPVPRRPSTASEQNLTSVDPSVLKLKKSVINNTVVSSKVNNRKVINSNVAVDSRSDGGKYVGGKRSARLITVDDQPLSHTPATADLVNNEPKTQKTLKAMQQRCSSQPHQTVNSNSNVSEVARTTSFASSSKYAVTKSTDSVDGDDGSDDSGGDVAVSVASSQTSWTAFHPNNNINNNMYNIGNNYSRNGGDSKGDKNIKRSNSSSVSYTQNSSVSNNGSNSSDNSQHPGCSSQDTSDSVFADLFPRTYKREVPTAPLAMSQSDVDILLNDQTIRSYGKSYAKHSSSASNVDLAVAVGTASSERASLLPEKESSTVHKVTPTEDDEWVGTTRGVEVPAQDTALTGSSGWGKRRKFVGSAATGADR